MHSKMGKKEGELTFADHCCMSDTLSYKLHQDRICLSFTFQHFAQCQLGAGQAPNKCVPSDEEMGQPMSETPAKLTSSP